MELTKMVNYWKYSLLASFTFIVVTFLLPRRMPTTCNTTTNTGETFRHVWVHLDLKGARPTVEYLEEFLPFIHGAGATGILLEYEDSFPWTGQLAELRSPDSYSIADIQKILNIAKKSQLEVVPLVQTLGHLEFVLKHAKYAHFREIPDYPATICSFHNEAKLLLKTMIDQLTQVHNRKIHRLHLGGDEAWTLGSCQECAFRTQNFDPDSTKCTPSDLDHSQIFNSHMVEMAEYVSAKGLEPIIWDDMLRHFSTEEMKPLGDAGMSLMVWGYVDDLSNFFPDNMWENYLHVFGSRRLFGASSFKGADTATSDVPPASYHARNNEEWVGIQRKVGLNGITLTGWQRYDHFSLLCELLPTSIPSLLLSLNVVLMGEYSVETRQRSQVEDFPGKKGYDAVMKLEAEKKRCVYTINTMNGWLTPGQIASDFYTKFHGKDFVASMKWTLSHNTVEVEGQLMEALDGIIAPLGIKEYVSTKVSLLRENCEHALAMAESRKINEIPLTGGNVKRSVP